MAHGVMEGWVERGCEKSPGHSPGHSPGPASSSSASSSGRVMGSRRIFAPQFKLQVLDSYRMDVDCKGNQRATARKYGIHRRQIQKWLQMESHLRSLTGAASSVGAPSSPGGGSTASLTSPVPSPSPVSSSSHSSATLLLASEPLGSALGALAPHVTMSMSMHQVHSALNLSCEARLLGGMGLGLGLRGTIGGASPSPHPPSGSGSPLRAETGASPPASPPASPATSTHGSPAYSPAPHQGLLGHEAQVVPVPRPSASPTLPIKKRWCQSPEQTPTSSPPPLPLGLGSDDEDDDDEEDDDEEDVDVDGTESDASSALDYTTATLSKRRSFSLQFKLEVLDAFKERPHCQGNQRATARAYGINRRQVQKWLGQETDLRDEAVSRGGLNRQRLGRWLDQEDVSCHGAASDTGCLDLSRKRKQEPSFDLEDAETEAKRSRTRLTPEAALVATPGTRPSMRPALLGDADGFRPHPGLPPHPLLFKPQPVSLPLMPPFPLPLSLPPLPFNICAKQYSVDLKLSTLDYFNVHQQNLQKWLKPEDFLKHSSNASFVLNSFR